MFIVLEGCDGTGKSTLAGAVAAEIMGRDPDCSVEEIHRGPLKRPPLDEYVHDVADYLPGGLRHIVADRWHWGEEIYGPIYRDKSAMTLGQFRWVELWLASRGVDVWHVTQPLDRLQSRLQARGEDFLQADHVDLVRGMFEDLAGKSAVHTGTVMPDGDISLIVKQIVDRAEYTEREIGDRIVRFPSYVGRAVPHTLLVGEKRGGTPPYVTDSAFMAINGNSGDFLLSSLPDDDWWKGVALVNGVEEGDKLVQLVDELAGPQVVALGRAASDVLLDLDIDHGGVPHPQFVRRFHNKRKAEYGRMIKQHAQTGEMKYSWPS